MDILIALAIMLPISLIACIALSLLSHLFAVDEDPKKKELLECLPGINCGACGFKGCDDYAEAIVSGKAKPNLCVPGAQKVANQLSEIMAVEPEKFLDVVAFVGCNGTCAATGEKAAYEGIPSCSAANMLYAGTGNCSYACLGFGDCAAVCPNDAICLMDGIARVDTSRCVGCGLCKKACPKHIISMLPQDAAVAVMCSNKQKGADARKACKNACIGCKKCEKACPEDAITVTDNLARVDYSKCSGCRACVSECPTGCLKSVCFPDLTEEIY